MKTITSSLSNAKAKLNYKLMGVTSTMTAGLATVGLAFCSTVNANSSMQKFLKTLFNVIMFAGVILAVAGAVSLIRTVISMASGEQAQPGALGKGIGLLVGGIILCAAKAVITAIIGVDPTTMTFI